MCRALMTRSYLILPFSTKFQTYQTIFTSKEFLKNFIFSFRYVFEYQLLYIYSTDIIYKLSLYVNIL